MTLVTVLVARVAESAVYWQEGGANHAYAEYWAPCLEVDVRTTLEDREEGLFLERLRILGRTYADRGRYRERYGPIPAWLRSGASISVSLPANLAAARNDGAVEVPLSAITPLGGGAER